MISGLVLIDRHCAKCNDERNLWSKLLEASSKTDAQARTPKYADLAFRGFSIELKVVEFHYPIERLSATDYDLLVCVHSARRQYEAYKLYKQRKEEES